MLSLSLCWHQTEKIKYSMENASNIIKYCTYTPVSQRFNF